jgi:hypothetical protein
VTVTVTRFYDTLGAVNVVMMVMTISVCTCLPRCIDPGGRTKMD